MIPLSPLQLKQHFFTHFAVRAFEKGSPEAVASFEPAVFCEREPELANHWRLGLVIKLKGANHEKPLLYEVEVALQGIVEVNSDFPEEKREQLAFVNGLSLLYSASREMLLTATGRCAHGPMCLPTLNFAEIFAGWNAENKTKEPRRERGREPAGKKSKV